MRVERRPGHVEISAWLWDEDMTKARRKRAGRHVLDRMFKGATVQDGEAARVHSYGMRHKDTWVVYKHCAGTGLRAFDVVVICGRTGRVLYEGSAGDEG